HPERAQQSLPEARPTALLGDGARCLARSEPCSRPRASHARRKRSASSRREQVRGVARPMYRRDCGIPLPGPYLLFTSISPWACVCEVVHKLPSLTAVELTIGA